MTSDCATRVIRHPNIFRVWDGVEINMATAYVESDDTSVLYQRLRKEAECPLCHKTVEEPKRLPCNHSFCLKCLNRQAMDAVKEGKSDIICVGCRSFVKIPGHGAFDDLPTPFYLSRIAEVMSIGVSDSGKKICGSCNESKTMHSYCFECEQFLCRSCEDNHKCGASTQSHRTVLIHELKEQDFERIIRRPVMCEKENHEKQPVDFYCHDCKVCICKLCVDEVHNIHNVEGVEKASEQSKVNIMDAVQELKTVLADCEAEIQRRKKGALRMERNIKAVEEEVHKNVEELILKLRLHEQEALAKLENLGNENQSAFQEQQEKNASRLAMLRDFLAYGENVLQSDLPLPVLDDHITFVEQFGQTLHVEDEDNFDMLHVNYVPNEEFADILKSSLGKVVIRSTDSTRSALEETFSKKAEVGTEMCFTIITRDQEGVGFYCEDDQVIVHIFTPTGEELQREIEDGKDGRYKVTCTPQSCGKHRVVIEVNGEALAGGPWTVKVISEGAASGVANGT